MCILLVQNLSSLQCSNRLIDLPRTQPIRLGCSYCILASLSYLSAEMVAGGPSSQDSEHTVVGKEKAVSNNPERRALRDKYEYVFQRTCSTRNFQSQSPAFNALPSQALPSYFSDVVWLGAVARNFDFAAYY